MKRVMRMMTTECEKRILLFALFFAGPFFAGPLAQVFAGALLQALAVLHQGLCRGDKRYWLVAWKKQ